MHFLSFARISLCCLTGKVRFPYTVQSIPRFGVFLFFFFFFFFLLTRKDWSLRSSAVSRAVSLCAQRDAVQVIHDTEYTWRAFFSRQVRHDHGSQRLRSSASHRCSRRQAQGKSRPMNSSLIRPFGQAYTLGGRGVSRRDCVFFFRVFFLFLGGEGRFNCSVDDVVCTPPRKSKRRDLTSRWARGRPNQRVCILHSFVTFVSLVIREVVGGNDSQSTFSYFLYRYM